MPNSVTGATSTTPSHPPVAEFVTWLDQRVARIVDDMFAAVVAATPSVVRDDADERLLREALDSHMPLLREAAQAATPRVGVQLGRPAERWARRLARAETDLADLVLAYDAAADVLFSAFAAHLRETRVSDARRAEALETVFDRLFRYLRAACAAATAAYVQEGDLLRQRDASDLRSMMSEVLAGTADIASAEARLGYRFADTHTAFVVWGAHATSAELDRAVARLRAVARPRQLVAVPDGPTAVHGWFSGGEVDGWASGTSGLRLALGSPHQGLAGLRASHQEAAEAWRLATRWVDGPLVRFDEVVVLALADGTPGLAVPWATARLGALADPAHSDLLRTLAIWLAELGSPTRAARRLTVHPNTVVKRLERIATLLPVPLDPRSAVLRVAVELAPLTRG
ncbi:helix-turn-helix domain-containing protein [Pseudonocardia kujensis]|uniref:PucR family transcriptional regulator n=1 Tax=Pseudonocardia kujensis TaxID=1128675 RepID=UPI001E613024|nr:PucR family transcriptional regulator [Pseudonocardia kujensis]MCE0765106.1 helix-turn-helix domain-containing protein [Pseudonocardia kujensis]